MIGIGDSLSCSLKIKDIYITILRIGPALFIAIMGYYIRTIALGSGSTQNSLSRECVIKIFKNFLLDVNK